MWIGKFKFKKNKDGRPEPMTPDFVRALAKALKAT